MQKKRAHTANQECKDSKCPFHGSLSIRKRVFVGTVVSDKMKNSVVVRRDYHHYEKKFLRYDRRHSHIAAHNPSCIEAKRGDVVKIAECRPLSKTISFVVIEKLQED
ncbi:30S ribosomal protein S17 [Candidatus Bathyarchaeota archaeon]|nr:30S ribosomal protein S17 [Candidatus Bathyarchaeota archaeon]